MAIVHRLSNTIYHSEPFPPLTVPILQRRHAGLSTVCMTGKVEHECGELVVEQLVGPHRAIVGPPFPSGAAEGTAVSILAQR